MFPDVVKALTAVGIERYHADLVAGTKTFYTPDGSFEVVSCNPVRTAALDFAADGVEKAVRATQRGEIKYQEFCARIAAAGCVDPLAACIGSRAWPAGLADGRGSGLAVRRR